MNLFTCLSLVLCLAASAAQAANDDFAGVGLELGMVGKSIVVKRILPDTPAAAQNDLHLGDRIVAVAQGQAPAVQGQTLVQTARLIRGRKGSTVRVTVLPAGGDESQVRVLSFVRGEVKVPWGDGLLLTTETEAPDIAMVEVGNQAGERLANYAGKIVVLEFWASVIRATAGCGRGIFINGRTRRQCQAVALPIVRMPSSQAKSTRRFS